MEAPAGRAEVQPANPRAADAARFNRVEIRLEERTATLADVSSTSQAAAPMDQLLSRTMASLDDRLTTMARSIEPGKTAR